MRSRAVVGTLDALQRVQAEHSEAAAVLEGHVVPSSSPLVTLPEMASGYFVSNNASSGDSSIGKIVALMLNNGTENSSTSP